MAIHSLDGVEPELPADGRFWIAPDARVIGRVRLGEDVGVWFGAVIRGDIEPIIIGDASNIQEHSVLHTDRGFPLTIGTGCTVGHRAILHGCTIGNNSLIGMGAIVLNGAKIGENSLVAAGALVPEGRDYPDGALIIGSPGRVVRMLDEAAIMRLRLSAANYVENARRFARGLA